MRSATITILSLVLCHCGSESDVSGDASSDTSVDDATSEGDVEPDDGGPVTCEGTDTLTIQVTDDEDAPLEGVEVALRCGPRDEQATSDEAGEVTFEGLDLESVPVDFTLVHDERAISHVGYGGAAGTPDVFTVTFGDRTPEGHPVSGALSRSVADSRVLLGGYGGGRTVIEQDTWEITSWEGTEVPISAMEYTVEGRTATPVGCTMLAIDVPEGGTSGLDLDLATAGECETGSIDLDFDLGADSPLRQVDRPCVDIDGEWPSRQLLGVQVFALDEEDVATMCGYTTRWAGNFGDGVTAEVAWLPGLEAEGYELRSMLTLVDAMLLSTWIQRRLPDIAEWDTLTVHDIPSIPGLEEAAPAPFDFVVQVERPGWAEAIPTYHIRFKERYGVMVQRKMQWIATVGPGVGSFSFADLPWPSGADRSSILPSGPLAPQMYLGTIHLLYDEDPFAGYVAFIDDEWGETHYIGTAGNSQFRIQAP